MTRHRLNLLVDTNVWLDYFLGRKHAKDAVRMLNKARECEDVVATAPCIMKDVFYIASSRVKKRARSSGANIDDGDGRAINAAAWSCLKSMQERSIIVGQGFGQHLEAMLLEEECSDYEDDLLVATAKTCSIDYIITNDQKLIKANLFPTMTPKEYVA